MLNNRRFIRCSYSYGAVISNNDKDWKEVAVENISAGGLNFYVKTAIFKIGEELNFKLEIDPDDPEFVNHKTKAKGKIVRMKPSGDDRIEYGVEFIEKDIASLGRIINYIMS